MQVYKIQAHFFTAKGYLTIWITTGFPLIKTELEAIKIQHNLQKWLSHMTFKV